MFWDQDRLRRLIEERLSDFQIILVSSREPYLHIYRGRERQDAAQLYPGSPSRGLSFEGSASTVRAS